VPYNPGAIPESAFAPSECFVADAQQSTEKPVTTAILNFVDTAGMSSAVWLSVSEGHQCTRRRILSLSDSTSEDKSYESASEKYQSLRKMNSLLFMNCARFLNYQTKGHLQEIRRLLFLLHLNTEC
jgi:hypothetical protein